MRIYFRPLGLVGAAFVGAGLGLALFAGLVVEPAGVIWGTVAVIVGLVMMWAAVERRAA